MKNIKIINVYQIDNLVKVVVTADGWQPTVFIFSDYHIICYGDIESFTWGCTWNTADEILKGNCYAKNPSYLTGKLEHKSELKQFDDDCFQAKMKEVKEELLNSFDEDEEKIEFEEKWNDNEYLLDDVDGYRLGNVDTFFDNLDIEDYYEYYDDFFKLPVHYECALEFLKAIENYFKENKKLD